MKYRITFRNKCTGVPSAERGKVVDTVIIEAGDPIAAYKEAKRLERARTDGAKIVVCLPVESDNA